MYYTQPCPSFPPPPWHASHNILLHTPTAVAWPSSHQRPITCHSLKLPPTMGKGGEDNAGDRQLESELATLLRERDEIISGAAIDASAELVRFRVALASKLKVAADKREYQRAHLRLQFAYARQQAMDEFREGKAKIREQIISSYAERKKRLDAFKVTGGKTQCPFPPRLTSLSHLASLCFFFFGF